MNQDLTILLSLLGIITVIITALVVKAIKEKDDAPTTAFKPSVFSLKDTPSHHSDPISFETDYTLFKEYHDNLIHILHAFNVYSDHLSFEVTVFLYHIFLVSSSTVTNNHPVAAIDHIMQAYNTETHSRLEWDKREDIIMQLLDGAAPRDFCGIIPSVRRANVGSDAAFEQIIKQMVFFVDCLCCPLCTHDYFHWPASSKNEEMRSQYVTRIFPALLSEMYSFLRSSEQIVQRLCDYPDDFSIVEKYMQQAYNQSHRQLLSLDTINNKICELFVSMFEEENARLSSLVTYDASLELLAFLYSVTSYATASIFPERSDTNFMKELHQWMIDNYIDDDEKMDSFLSRSDYYRDIFNGEEYVDEFDLIYKAAPEYNVDWLYLLTSAFFSYIKQQTGCHSIDQHIFHSLLRKVQQICITSVSMKLSE